MNTVWLVRVGTGTVEMIKVELSVQSSLEDGVIAMPLAPIVAGSASSKDGAGVE